MRPCAGSLSLPGQGYFICEAIIEEIAGRLGQCHSLKLADIHSTLMVQVPQHGVSTQDQDCDSQYSIQTLDRYPTLWYFRPLRSLDEAITQAYEILVAGLKGPRRSLP